MKLTSKLSISTFSREEAGGNSMHNICCTIPTSIPTQGRQDGMGDEDSMFAYKEDLAGKRFGASIGGNIHT